MGVATRVPPARWAMPRRRRRVPAVPPEWSAAARRWAVASVLVGTAGMVAALVVRPVHHADLPWLAGLVLGGWLSAVAPLWLGEPSRASRTADVDLLSVWTFAAVMLLPPAPAGLVALGIDLAAGSANRSSALLNRAFNAASVCGSVLAASAAYHAVASALPGPARLVAVAAGMAVLLAVNMAPIAEIMRRQGIRLSLAMFNGWAGIAGEAAAACTGAVVATVWHASPAMAPLVAPVVVLLQRSLLHRDLLTAARTDPKTRLVNSARWNELATRQLERARHDGEPVTVLLVDLDHFKRVNDLGGHLVGDELLVAVAAGLRAACRPTDLVGRFGGEEFAVLLPATGRSSAGRRADALRRAVRETALTRDGRRYAVTASVGAATTEGPAGWELHALLAAADAAMYRAKGSGRDAVVVDRQVGAA